MLMGAFMQHQLHQQTIVWGIDFEILGLRIKTIRIWTSKTSSRNQRRMTPAVTGHAKCIPRNTTMVADIGVISGHFKTLDHLNNVTKYTLGSKQPKISSFTIKNTNDGVARAQILLSTFLATKHIPISVSKGLIDVCRLPSIQNPCPKPS